MNRFKNWRRIAGWLLALGIFIFLGQAIISTWGRATASGFEFRFDWPPLALSLLLLVAARAFVVESWRRILWALGDSLHYRTAYYAWFVSNLARYIPGNVWQVATLMVIVDREGVSKTNVVLSQAVYTVIALSMAGLLGLWLLPIPPLYQPAVAVLLLLVIPVFAHPRVFDLMVKVSRGLLARLRSLLSRADANGTPGAIVKPRPRLTFARGLIAPLASALCWSMNGVAFYFFIRSVSPVTWEQLPAIAAIFCASYFFGYVSFVTPSGLGFREGMMTLLLTPYFPTPVAVALAFAARLWATAGELLGAGIAVLEVPRRSAAARSASLAGPEPKELGSTR